MGFYQSFSTLTGTGFPFIFSSIFFDALRNPSSRLLSTVNGYILSAIAIFIFIGTFLFQLITSSGFFDFQFNQGLWLFLYLIEGVFFGMIGDGLIFYYRLQKKHCQTFAEAIYRLGR